jgi:predicted nucleotidyltransferase
MTVGQIAETVRLWAAGEPLVRRAYLFGSRARGDHQPDSDVDLAVVCRMDPRVLAQCCGDRFTARGLFWEVYGPGWQAELGRLFPVRVHLEVLDRDTTRVVRPAVKCDGIRIV